MKVNISVKRIQALVDSGTHNMMRAFLEEGGMDEKGYIELAIQVNKLLWNLSHASSIHEIFNMVEYGEMEFIGYENIDGLISDLQ